MKPRYTIRQSRLDGDAFEWFHVWDLEKHKTVESFRWLHEAQQKMSELERRNSE
jgi:hypothetical protein